MKDVSWGKVFKNEASSERGNRALYLARGEIYCNSCFLRKPWDAFSPGRITTNRATCKTCHSDYSYQAQLRKRFAKYPGSCRECSRCDRLYSSRNDGCPYCEGDRG